MEPSKAEKATELNLHNTVRLSAEGWAKVLGDLEARVMRVVWAIDAPSTAREVHERVIVEHDVALLTVVTVLNKLVDKRLLQRRKHESLFHYEASLTESEFRAQVSRRVMEGILSFGPEALATSFVDVLAERDPVQLEALQKLIEERLQKGEK